MMKGINTRELVKSLEVSYHLIANSNVEEAYKGKPNIAILMVTGKDTTLVVRLFEMKDEVVIKVLGFYPMFPSTIALLGSQENEEEIKQEMLGYVEACLRLQFKTVTIKG
jgi:hypothetical protein